MDFGELECSTSSNVLWYLGGAVSSQDKELSSNIKAVNLGNGDNKANKIQQTVNLHDLHSILPNFSILQFFN